MKIITCAGYYGTGSSAITDLLSEFENVHSMGEYEFRFLQDPEGISDLEFNLVENHHRHNSGHALKRYKKYVDFISGNKIIKKYEPYFNYRFKELSYEYIDNLTIFKTKGMWQQDIIDKGKLFYFIDRSINKIYTTIMRKIFNKTEISMTLLNNEITYYSKPGSDFYSITKEYTRNLFKEANKTNSEILMVDQLVPPNNISRYLNYFDNIKVIVVDRDPRDIYILEKLYWKGKIVPYNDVELFCKWYEYTRENNNSVEDKSKIMRIMFEDLIYTYDNTVSSICDFIETTQENHIYNSRNLDISKSINNTRLWVKHTELKKEIKYIENRLERYLYKK